MATRHLDNVLDYDGSVIVTLSVMAECTDYCTPATCEAAHREATGWAAVEEAVAWERDNPRAS